MPDPDDFPTGDELVRNYVEPLAASPELVGAIETGARVAAISRIGVDKVVSRNRAASPFMLVIETAAGVRRDRAQAVIDASGTWRTPNPIGAAGLPAEGEDLFSDRISYGVPDVLGRHRQLYAGKTTLVVGSGHSAGNALIDLARLARQERGAKAIWGTRGTDLARIYGGGDADQLPARGELGAEVRQLVESGRVDLVTGFSIVAVRDEDGGILVDGETSDGRRSIGPVDRVIAATGQRPDLSLTRELRLELDPWLESAKSLGPLIDPNVHSCGSVPPHGHRELSHPEPGFYTIGVKSYGRAPTFLLLTGYEQARSVAAALAGDMTAADDVHLILPETGVCTTRAKKSESASAGRCGGPASVEVDACCLEDTQWKVAGKVGCGCSTAA
jgi:thioredoxin reductase